MLPAEAYTQLLNLELSEIARYIQDLEYRREIDRYGSTLSGADLIETALVDNLAKDVGELGAAIGAIHTFIGVFNEAAISQAFGFVFSAYFTGLSISLICSALANYLRSKEVIYAGSLQMRLSCLMR